MTDRHAAYIVTLKRDMREDDAAESVLAALRMIRGVAGVEPVLANPDQQIAEIRRDQEWHEALFALVREGPPRQESPR